MIKTVRLHLEEDTRGYIFTENDLQKPKGKPLSEWMDTPIFRIFPVGRFIQAITNKQLSLVKPKMWDDPYENALLSSEFLVDGEPVEFGAKDSVYGQCWTLHRETDAMWRIYSNAKDGVRVRSTPRKLLAAMKKHVGEFASVRCFIGKVQYVPVKSINDEFKKIQLLKTDGSGIAKSLLYKRFEFSHEKEMRLIYSGEDGKCDSNFFTFPIDPNEVFDRVLFDPRMEETLRKSYMEAIKTLGCKVEVKRSTLYDAPKKVQFKL